MERRQAAALQNVIKSHRRSFTATPTAKFKLLFLKRSAYSRAAVSLLPPSSTSYMSPWASRVGSNLPRTVSFLPSNISRFLTTAGPSSRKESRWDKDSPPPPRPISILLLEQKGEEHTVYYQPRGQLGLAVMKRGNGESDGGRHSRTKSKVEAWVRSFFLPAGYPASVGSTYWQFQKWEVLKSAIGSATYVISTKALLTAVGLGAAGSSTGAAAIAWVLKDGLGCMGTMLVAGAFGKYFDSETKRIRWAADLLHVTGVGLELITPLCPVYFLPLASLANAAKGIAGLTNGATRASIYKSFALEENLGDITAKGQSQGIAAYLAGMGLGIGITLLVGTSIDAAGLFFTFGSLSCLQLYFSYKALTGVKLSTLNTQRTYFLIKHFLHSRQVEQSNQNEDYCASNTIRGDVLTPAEVQEYIIGPAPYGRMVQHIVLGSSVADALAALSRAAAKQYGGKGITEMQPNIIASCLLQRLVKEAFAKEKYLLAWNCNNSGPAHVLLHKDATSEDILKAFFNAYLLKFFSSDSLEQFHEGINDHSAATCRQPNQDQSFEAIHQSLHKTQQLFPKFLHGLKQNGWNMHVFLGTRPNRAIWGDALSLPQ